jgi:hypothetical protein
VPERLLVGPCGPPKTPRCLGTLNIPITPSSFRNFGKEQLGTDFGKQALRPP